MSGECAPFATDTASADDIGAHPSTKLKLLEAEALHFDRPLLKRHYRRRHGAIRIAPRYRKADAGLITNFTGINSPCEAPLAPDLLLDSSRHSAEVLVERGLKTI